MCLCTCLYFYLYVEEKVYVFLASSLLRVTKDREAGRTIGGSNGFILDIKSKDILKAYLLEYIEPDHPVLVAKFTGSLLSLGRK